MSVRILRLANHDVLTPVFTYDGENLRWWAQGDVLTHLELEGGTPEAAEVFLEGEEGPLYRVLGRKLLGGLLALLHPIPSERIRSIQLPPGGVLHGYQCIPRAKPVRASA